MTRATLACLAAVVAAAPASAEGNRLLPFWGQPFPAGYAWGPVEPGWRPSACPAGRRAGAIVSREGRTLRRCEIVLHARD